MVKNLLVVLLFVGAGSALFEDQVGKFDWSRQFIGNVKHASFANSGNSIAVGTQKNVFSVLDSRTGSVEFRHVLDSGAKGEIRFLHTFKNRVTVVTGDCTSYVVREFDEDRGVLLQERHHGSSLGSSACQWSARGGEILFLQNPTDGSVHLSKIGMKDGKKEEITTDNQALRNSRCALSSTSIICVDFSDGTLRKLSLTDLSPQQEDSILNFGFNSDDLSHVAVRQVPGLSSHVAVLTGEKALFVGAEENRVVSVGSDKCVWGGAESDGEYLLTACHHQKEVQMTLVDLTSGEKLMEGSFESQPAPSYAVPNLVRSPNGEIVNCQYVAAFEDHTLRFATVKGESWWTREEALASILAVEVVDLPVSEREAMIEEEFDSPYGGIVSRMAKRITSESYQIFLIFKEVLTGRKTTTSAGLVDRGLVRDKFGFHRMIIVATEANKLFGIDSLSGDVIWSRFVPSFESLEKQVDGKKVSEFSLFVLRGSAHHPLTALVALIGKNKVTSKPAIFTFNPITGTPDSGLSFDLPKKLKLVHQLNNLEGDTQFIRPVLFLDEDDDVTVVPSLAEGVKLTKSLYLTAGSSLECKLSGYKVSSRDKGLSSSLVWSLPVCSPESEWISAIAPKRAEENVHSQGRPLADRSVLYKYLNPNLLVVVVEGSLPDSKVDMLLSRGRSWTGIQTFRQMPVADCLEIKDSYMPGHVRILLVDSVTGNIVYSTIHKRATGPVHLVHSENWLVYTYYNEKFRRTELVSIELYEGKERSSELVVTSFDNIKPMIEKQAFIFPASIATMRETITKMGLTNKHILVSVPSRGVLELPRAFLDPRRPVVPTSEAREEGLVPYVPELPIPPEGIVNYNKTLPLATGIHTSPAGLESTCLVFVYGLDIFFTRVMPSKTFDVLKDDFDHLLISTVLIALIAASVVSRRLAAKKALRQAWK